MVAAICESTPGAVERNIRFCVTRAWGGQSGAIHRACPASHFPAPYHRRLPVHAT
ncbi:MAG: hypothetical protein ACLVHV_08640 [Oscillospiraceae bacterium]